MTTERIIAGTGHRPNKLGGYGPQVGIRLCRLAKRELERLRPTCVISGMALGWDQALAKAALDLQIPFHAYVPFAGQEQAWPWESQKNYRTLLSLASVVRTISPGGYSASKMQTRNEAMVNDCHLLLALWDGTSGGTANCINYARSVHRDIDNIWSSWLSF